VGRLVGAPDRLTDMGRRARALATPDAAERLVAVVLSAAAAAR